MTNMDTDMTEDQCKSELTLALTLFSYCRQLIRYSGVDPIKASYAYDGIKGTVELWTLHMEDSA
jgi:hypothetical protein